ncbi:conserved hypothetical protein [Altererythrobacter sp. B11]|uniref:hypothetical protein n=1 Tax=Altererythrobacter sp. B11 TaxID=2060312 RepID=UPI000DC72849|nr:hypothetical protein [Altererythrobacter sp. B11]BBC71693.1 conserved hypothetical protein [Altererythrobacter sp. B11]
MNLDELLLRYFHDTELSSVRPDMLTSGIERCQVDLALEQDRGKRFALWTLLHMFGAAPEIDVVFKDAGDRDAGRNLMDPLTANEVDAATE